MKSAPPKKKNIAFCDTVASGSEKPKRCFIRKMAPNTKPDFSRANFQRATPVGDVVAQWLVRRTWDLKIESSSPGRCSHIGFLGKTLNSHSASLHPGV